MYFYDSAAWHGQVRPVQNSLAVIDTKIGDVNGDRVPDIVRLMGVRSSDGSRSFVDQLSLSIQDGRTSMTYSIPLRENAGYHPTLFLGDFTGDRVNDILVSLDTGGSGGYSGNSMYSFLNNQAKLLFDSEQYNRQQQNNFSVTYQDYYRVEVKSTSPAKTYLIDIQLKGKEYLSDLYHPNGTLKKPVQGEVTALSGAFPIDWNRDGRYELLAIQRTIGLYNADTLGYVMNFLRWDGSKFTTYNQWFSIP